MTLESDVSRRTLLAAGAGGLGATVLAACSSSGSTTAPAGGAASTAAPAGGAGSTTTAPAGGAGSTAAAASAPLATLADIKVGEAVSVKLPDGKPGIVSRPTAATAVCFSAICTHEGCTVAPEATVLACPCHKSRFNALTGAVLSGPAPAPLEKVAVTVTGGKVLPA